MLMLKEHPHMADDKAKTHTRDRIGVAVPPADLVEFFALHHGISVEQARSLIEKYGNDRQALFRELKRLKS